jgi:hypothetical protein
MLLFHLSPSLEERTLILDTALECELLLHLHKPVHESEGCAQVS